MVSGNGSASRGSVLITGCSSGIGYATACHLRRLGWRVFATARDPRDVQRLLDQGLESVGLDLTDDTSIDQALAWVLTQTGGTLEAVFHNGAYGQPGALEDLDRDALRDQFETNLFGWHALTRAVLPVMRRQGRGRLIFNSSVLGLVCMPYRGAYNASKYATEALADTLRLELVGSSIDVVLIEPGPIDTRFREHALQAFQQRVSPERSPHRQVYTQMLTRLQSRAAPSRFTLPAESVARCVERALEAKRPKTRYYVTLPTYLFAYLKRLLPTTLLDHLLRRGGA